MNSAYPASIKEICKKKKKKNVNISVILFILDIIKDKTFASQTSWSMQQNCQDQSVL